MTDITELTPENFNENVATGVAIVDFWAPWCAQCRMMGKALEDKVAPALEGKAKVCKMNADEYQEYAAKLNVQNLPMIFIFKEGSLVKEFQGIVRPAELIAAAEEAMK